MAAVGEPATRARRWPSVGPTEQERATRGPVGLSPGEPRQPLGDCQPLGMQPRGQRPDDRRAQRVEVDGAVTLDQGADVRAGRRRRGRITTSLTAGWLMSTFVISPGFTR